MQPDPHMFEASVRRHRQALRNRQSRNLVGDMGIASLDPAGAVEHVLANTLNEGGSWALTLDSILSLPEVPR
jgi:hypothetical protein